MLLGRRSVLLLQLLLLLGVFLFHGIRLLLMLLFELLITRVIGFLLGSALMVLFLLGRQLLMLLILLLVHLVLLRLILFIRGGISRVRSGSRRRLNFFRVSRSGRCRWSFCPVGLGARRVVAFGASRSIVRRAFRSLIGRSRFFCRYHATALELIRALGCRDRRPSLVG